MKRSKKRFLYYGSYAVMGPIIKLMSMFNYNIQLSNGFQRFFWQGGVSYRNWRIMMADLEVRYKTTHDVILYMPNAWILIILAVVIGW